MFRFLVVVFASLVAPGPGTLVAGEVWDVATRGETVRIPVETPFEKKPLAVVVLFAGGAGVLEIDKYEFEDREYGAATKLTGNFLIRSGSLFTDHGFVAAAIDGPTDVPGNLYRFRCTEEHAEDTAAIKKVLEGG